MGLKSIEQGLPLDLQTVRLEDLKLPDYPPAALHSLAVWWPAVDCSHLVS